MVSQTLGWVNENDNARREILRDLCGTDPHRRAELIVCSAMLFCPNLLDGRHKINGSLFSNLLLRRIAAYCFGELAIYGDVADPKRVVRRAKLTQARSDALEITIPTLERVSNIITNEILTSAIDWLQMDARAAA